MSGSGQEQTSPDPSEPECSGQSGHHALGKCHSENVKIVKEPATSQDTSEDASSFFHSLQLHSNRHEIPEAVSDQDHEPREEESNKEKLEDLSFFESIGLYWVNPADKSQPGAPQGQVSEESAGQGDNRAEETPAVDEFDFLNVLGLTPVVGPGHGNKKWRLWNPEMDTEEAVWDEELLYRDLGLAGEQSGPGVTDPTVLEHLSPTSVPRHQAILEDSGPPLASISLDPADLNVNNRPKREIKRTALFEPENALSVKKLRVNHAKENISNVNFSDSKFQTDLQEPTKLSGRMILCRSCGASVSRHQYGKHLVSHYHVHRSIGHPDTETIILDNIQDIVHQSPFQCLVCQFYCNWHEDFVSHLRGHREDEGCEDATYWCQVCMKTINGHKTLMAHLSSYSHTELVTVINRSVPVIIRKINLMSCQLCERTFRFNLALKKHMQQGHGVRNFQLENHERYFCQYCTFVTYKKTSLKSHQFLVHPNSKLKYDCYICKKQFANKDSAQAHRNTNEHKLNTELHQTIEQQRWCDHCSEWFTDVEDLSRHLQLQHTSLLPQCHLCGSRFHFHQELTVHLKMKCQTASQIPSDDSPTNYQCTQCPFSSATKSVLSLHSYSKHRGTLSADRDTSGDILCPVPGVPGVAQHLVHQCQTCHQLCGTEQKLIKHSQRCGVEYKCKLCKYKSSKKILLNLHVKRQHCKNNETEEIFVCQLCSANFHSKSSFNNHVKYKHSGSKPLFNCKHCPLSFNFKSDLERHEITHSDSKSLSCEDCGFVCKRKSELIRHRKHVHENSPFKECNICGYKTKNSDHFKRHFDKKHQLNEVSSFEIHLDQNDFLISQSDNIPVASVPEFVTEQIVINN